LPGKNRQNKLFKPELPVAKAQVSVLF